MFRLVLMALVANLLCHSPAAARREGDSEEVAAALDRARRTENWPLAIRDSMIAPQWLSHDDRLVFWDAFGPAAGSWVLVDAASGRRRVVVSARSLWERMAILTGGDAPLPPQMAFTLTPDDHALLFRHAGAGFRLELATAQIVRIAANGMEDRLLDGAVPSPARDRVAVQHGDGFTVFDADGRVAFARDGTPDLGWQLPGHPWSPDGRLAVWRNDQRAVHRIPVVDYTSAIERVTMVPYAKVGTPIATAELHLLDPSTGALVRVRLPDEPGYRWLAGWRDDGTALVLHMARDGKRLDLLAVSQGGDVVRVLREERPRTKVADLNFAVDGWRSQMMPLGGSRGFLWMSERDGWRHVYHYRNDGRLIRQVTRGAFPVIRVDRVANDGTLLITAAGEAAAPYHEKLYRVPMRGGGLHAVAIEAGVHLAIPSPSGRYLVDSRSSWTTPRIRDLRRIDGTVVTRLTAADAGAVKDRISPEPIRVIAADGVTPLFGAMYRPAGFEPARRYPVVAYIYGGPFGTVVANGYTGSTVSRRAETLAAAGFIVVAIDVRGSAGRSRAFADATYGRIGSSEIPDYVAGLRQLGATRPWMDLSRVGIQGHSWGGYFAVRAMLIAPGTFKAGYAGAPGALDEDALVNEPDMGLRDANPGGYAGGSNLALAANLQGPLRIMHGTADINAPLSSSMRLVDALIRADKPVELLTMPDVGHDPEGAARDYYRDDVIRFFWRTLAAGQSPQRR